MEGKNNIAQYRGRLDRTLASHDLANEEILKILVKNQILQSSKCDIEEYIDNVVENRTKEVSNLIGMLRSAAMSDNEGQGLKSSEAAPHDGWKVKQDTQEYRVMYREGPQGTPFHTLLVEGYVDGPMDVCLCISMESGLYKKWWPQSTVPSFKVLSSECLQKVRIGEQISLVRMKVSWPLSAREAVVHYFAFEYFKDDLIIVLLKSISDLESIDKSTHGFTKDGIPVAQEVVRIDLVGGFAVQKVTADRSYFRTITNMDIKLDFVPPALINFISRQLIGSGFKLYQKEVASIAKGDEDFSKALKDPLYTRIREALYSANNKSNGIMKPEDHRSTDMLLVPEEHIMKTIPLAEESNNTGKIIPSEIQEIFEEDDEIEESGAPAGEDNENMYRPPTNKIMENFSIENNKKEDDEIEESGALVGEENENLYKPPTNQNMENFSIQNNKKKVVISREVEQALGTLEKVISMFRFREYEFNPKTRALLGLSSENSLDLAKGAPIDLTASADGEVCLKNDPIERTSHEPRNSSCSHGSRHTGSNSYTREANHNRIAPASPEEHIGNHTETTETPSVLEKKITNGDEPATDVDSKRKNNKKARFCCLHFIYGQKTAS